MSLYSELKRRNVFRVAVAYLAAAWLITEVTQTIFPLFGYGDTPARIMVILLAIGFPLFLIVSWVYEFTPEGLKLEKDIRREESITPQTGKRIDRLIIVLLTLAMAYLAVDKFILDPVEDVEIAESARQEGRSEAFTESYGDRSIAVLPFVNISADPEQEYFSDGISEELLNLLAKIPELRVISRSSSFSYKGKEIDIPTIAEQLNVAHILEGSVRRDGEQIRITAQLIEARSDAHLWSETYDRKLESIFAIQDEISAAIVGALKERLDLEVKVAPRVSAAANTEVLDAILRGRHLVAQRTQTSIENAVREFERAIELDPDYAPAHAELVEAYLLLRRDMYGGLTTTEAIAKATSHAERAMVLDPMLPEAVGNAGYLAQVQWNKEQALKLYRKALEINPNYAAVYHSMGYLVGIGYFGRYDEGAVMTEKAFRLNPLSISTHKNYVLQLITKNRLDEAEREIEKLAAISPRYAAFLQGYLLSLGGNWANGILGILDAVLIDPQPLVTDNQLAMRFAAIGLEREALAISEASSPFTLTMMRRHTDAVTMAEASLAEDPADFRAHRRLGMALASAGDYEGAGPILEDMWQRSGRRITTDGLFYADCAAALIAIRRAAGEEAEVGELIAAMKDNVRRYREAGITRGHWAFWDPVYEEGLANYLAGNREKGLELISRAVEGGFFIMPWEAYLQELYDDPGFAPIRARQEALRVRERNKFLAIACADNPYEAVWQPAEGTCEAFAAVGRN